MPKRLALFHELLPRTKRLAVLVNPINASDAQPTVRHATAAARALGLEIEVFDVGTGDELEAAFAALANWRADALFIGPDPLFTASVTSGGMRPVILAARHALPSSCFTRDLVEAGGLMSYGPDIADSLSPGWRLYRAHPQGREARRPSVQAPTKFELVINLKTAKALGLEVPPTLLARADEVIE